MSLVKQLCLVILTLGSGLIYSNAQAQSNTLLRISSGTVSFRSEAPLELIEAESDDLRGVLSVENQNFAFTLPINSFEGFNSPLQQEHFNENYMESDRYKEANFTGSIIDAIDINEYGTSDVRVKGKFKIHGVENTHIISIKLTNEADKLSADGSFDIKLEDYNISIPRIVNKKIAEIIKVDVHVEFKKAQ